jgi:hypothetical protein
MKSLGGCVDEPFWISPSTKFIFLPKTAIKADDVIHVLWFFEAIRRLNVVMIYEEVSIKMFTFNVLKRDVHSLASSTNVDVVFPDKLSNLNQYRYNVVASIQPPRLYFKNGKFYGFDVLFMEIVAKKQNASLYIGYVNYSDPNIYKQYVTLMGTGKIDVSLSTISSAGTNTEMMKYYKNFNTYDVNGYCALVPIPPRDSFLKYLFVPYDTASWILMLVSLIALAIVWKVFQTQRESRGLSSVGRIIFRVIAGFLGQAFDFVATRWFHFMVMQIFIFMVLILGNAYQSILISLMTVSRNGTRITTVNEMMAGDYNFLTDSVFYENVLKVQPKVIKKFKTEQSLYLFDKFNYEATATNNSVLVMRCDTVNDAFYSDNIKFDHGKPSDYYYILPEKFLALYETLMTGRFCPFIERLGEISLRIFESGIKQHWDTLLHSLTDHIDLEQISIMKEEFLLKMGDFKYVFYIWAIGMSVATIAFVAELLCYKYRVRIRKTWAMKMMRRLSWSRRVRKREMMMVRRRARVVIEPFEEFEMIQC